MTGTIGIGLISVGWMGRLHSRSYDRVNYHYPALALRPRLVIAADVLAEQARFAVDALGYQQATADWREVVHHPAVQAVSITAPNFLHREMAEEVASAGKHFWIEKPVGRDVSDADAVARAAEKAGVRTAVGFNYRHAPSVQYARDLIGSGRIGRVTHVRGQFLNDFAADPNCVLSWRFQRARSGLGVLGDLMTHVIDLLHYLLGPVVEACALTSIMIPERPLPGDGPGSHFAMAPGGELGTVETDDYAAGLLRFAAGPVGTVEASRISVGPRCRLGFEIYGTEGSVCWDFERMNELRVCLGLAGDGHGYSTVAAGPGHGDYANFQPGPAISMGYDDLKVTEAALFLRSIATGEQVAPSVHDARLAAHVVEAMRRSAESGGWHSTAKSLVTVASR